MAKYRKYSIGDEGGEAGLDKPDLGDKAMCSKSDCCSVQCAA